jgi:surface antigen
MLNVLKAKKIICGALLVLLTAGCTDMGPKESGGRLIGAATGALIGSQFGKGSGKLVGVAIGTLAGSYLGGSIGQRMDAQDRQLAQGAMMDCLERAPDRQSIAWQNPNNRHCGNVQVLNTQDYPEDYMVCRDYVHTVTIDGRQERVHGRACRDVRDTRAMWKVTD